MSVRVGLQTKPGMDGEGRGEKNWMEGRQEEWRKWRRDGMRLGKGGVEGVEKCTVEGPCGF